MDAGISLTSDSKDVVSSMGLAVEVREVSASQVAELATSSSFAHTREQVGQGDARDFSTGTIISLAKKSAEDGLIRLLAPGDSGLSSRRDRNSSESRLTSPHAARSRCLIKGHSESPCLRQFLCVSHFGLPYISI